MQQLASKVANAWADLRIRRRTRRTRDLCGEQKPPPNPPRTRHDRPQRVDTGSPSGPRGAVCHRVHRRLRLPLLHRSPCDTASPWSSLGWLPRLTQQTVVITGTADALMPAANASLLACRMPRVQVLHGVNGRAPALVGSGGRSGHRRLRLPSLAREYSAQRGRRVRLKHGSETATEQSAWRQVRRTDRVASSRWRPALVSPR